MAYTIEQYNNLIDTIASLAKRVKYSDKEVEYRELEDLLKLKSSMESELGIGVKPVRRKQAYVCNGINPHNPDWKNERYR